MTHTRILLQLRIPDELREQVRQAADEDYTTMTAWIIDAINRKLRTHERELEVEAPPILPTTPPLSGEQLVRLLRVADSLGIQFPDDD